MSVSSESDECSINFNNSENLNHENHEDEADEIEENINETVNESHGSLPSYLNVDIRKRSQLVKAVEQLHPITQEVLRIYPSRNAAAEFMNICAPTISNCCNNKQSKAGGFYWRFYEGPPFDFAENEPNFLSLEELQEIQGNKSRKNNVNASRVGPGPGAPIKAVEQLHPITKEVLRMYPSVKEAAEFMNITPCFISICCKNPQRRASGFFWRFYEGPTIDWNEAEDNFLSSEELQAIHVPELGLVSKVVEQLHPVTKEVVRIYPSVKAAGEFMNINASQLSKCCRNQTKGGGFFWKYYEGPMLDWNEVEKDFLSLEELKAIQSSKKNISTSLPSFEQFDLTDKIIEQCHPITNEVLRVYPSIQIAADSMNVTINHIFDCCLSKRYKAGGFIWRFYDGPPIDWEESEKNFLSIKELERMKKSSSTSLPHVNGSATVGASPASRSSPKEVVQLHPETKEIVRIYPSINAAAKFMSVGANSISTCCKNQNKKAYGFYWKFYDGPPINWTEEEEKFLSLEELQKISGITTNTISTSPLIITGARASSKAVEQLHPITKEVLRIYPSVSAASKFMGCFASLVSNCCNNKQSTGGGFGWRFYEGPPINWEEAEKSFLSLEELHVIQGIRRNNSSSSSSILKSIIPNQSSEITDENVEENIIDKGHETEINEVNASIESTLDQHDEPNEHPNEQIHDDSEDDTILVDQPLLTKKRGRKKKEVFSEKPEKKSKK